jgi:SAM-dependent methyltransferase
MTRTVYQLDETARWGAEWQSASDWKPHTVARPEADRIARGYVGLLQLMGAGERLGDKKAIGIGSGAGHLEAALAEFSIDVTASEWNEVGIRLIRSQNPSLNSRIVDLVSFHDIDAWDIIVCRELYPFTRTNPFSRHYVILSHLIDALRPGGVVILSGSTVSWPHCLDYKLMFRELRSDPRVHETLGPILEPVVKRMRFGSAGKFGLQVQAALGALALWAINASRREQIAGIGVYAIRKSPRC